MTHIESATIDAELRRGRVRPFTTVQIQRLVGNDWCVTMCRENLRGGRQRRWIVRTWREWEEKREEMLNNRFTQRRKEWAHTP